MISCLITGAYGLIELLNMLNNIDTRAILKAVSNVIQLYSRG